MTATAVSAADEIQHPHKDERHPVGQTQEGIVSTTGMTTTITTFMTATTMMFT